MADNVDSISIELTASTASAESSIDRLIGKLNQLKSAVSGASNFSKVAQGIARIAAVASGIDGDAGRKLNHLAAGLTALSKAGSLANLKDAGKNLASVTRAVSDMGQTGGKGLSGLADGIRQTSEALGGIKDSDVNTLGAIRDTLAGEVSGPLHTSNITNESAALGGMAKVDVSGSGAAAVLGEIGSSAASTGAEFEDLMNKNGTLTGELETLLEDASQTSQALTNTGDSSKFANMSLEEMERTIGSVTEQLQAMAGTAEMAGNAVQNATSNTENTGPAQTVKLGQFNVNERFANYQMKPLEDELPRVTLKDETTAAAQASASFKATLDDMANSAGSVAEKLESAGASARGFSEKINSVTSGSTANLSDLAKQIEQARKEYEQAKELPVKSLKDVGFNEDNPRWADLLRESAKAYAQDIEAARQKLEQLEETQRRVAAIGNDSGLASSSGIIKQFTDTISNARTANLNMSTISEIARRVASDLAELAGAFKRVGSAAKIVSIVGGFVKNVLSGIGNIAHTASAKMGALTKVLANVGSAFIRNGLGAIPRYFGGRLIGNIQNATKGMTGFFNSIVRIAKYRLIRTALRMITQGINEGIKNLYSFSQAAGGTFAASMNQIATASQYMGNSFAAMAGPLVNALAPAIDFIVDKFVDMFNTINQIISRLTGKTTYTAAKKVAATWGDAAKSSSGSAKKAADEIKRTLMGFDEINKLNDTASSGGSGGGGGGGGSSASSMFEELPIDGAVSSFADSLKSAFEAGNWQELGTLLGSKVNELVDSIDFAGAGKKVGYYINGWFSTKYWTLDTINFTNIGSKIAEFLNNAIKEIDFNLLGKLMAQELTIIGDAAIGFFTEFDWGQAGKAFSDALNGLFDAIDWSKLSSAATTGINGAIKALKNAVSGFKWGQAAINLADAINKLFDGVDWDALGEVASKAINGILATMKTLVSGFRWANAGENITNAINRIFDGVNWDDLADTASDALNGILATMKTVVSGFRWDNAATNITNAINRLFDGVDWDALSDTATTALNKIIAAIKTTVSGFRWANAGTTFGNTLNSLFSGIDWTELGVLASEAIGKPLEALRKAVSTFSFGDAGTAFAGIVKGFFENKQLWEDAGTIVSESIKGMFKFGKDFLDEIPTEDISEAIRKFVENIDWGGIAKAIFNFALSAMRAIGNLFLALIFGPDYKDKTAKVQEAQDYLSGIVDEISGGKNYTVNWGLRPAIDYEAFDALATAFEDALKTGNFVIPTDVEIDPASVAACYNDFVKQWNLTNPTAPLEPILPEDVGPLIQAQLSGMNKQLSVDVLARLSPTPAEGSSSVPVVFGSSFNVNANLTGKTSDSMALTPTENRKGVFDKSFNVNANLTGKTGESMALTPTENRKGVFDKSFNVNANLTGKTGDSKDLTPTNNRKGVFNNTFNAKSKLTGATKDSLKLSGSKNSVYPESFKVKTNVIKGWSGTAQQALGVDHLKTDMEVNLKKGANDTIEIKQSGGGGGGGKWVMAIKELGGIFMNGLWSSIPQYARGTLNAMHGSMFLAGEAGPELVGHVGGRTEVLNQSQLAATMFSAVRNAMGGVKIAATMYDGGTDNSEADYETMYRAMYDAFTDAMAMSNERDKEKVALMREIAAKDFTAEVTAASINRAQRRMNRRAGTTIVPVGT